MTTKMQPASAPADDAPPATVAVPPVDILETTDELLVRLDLPGVAPADVDVRFEDGQLTVSGRRAGGPVGFARGFRVTERIAADKIAADLVAGVLTLKLPKVDAVKPRRIAVTG
jgi:HSP20 family protein